MHIKFTDTECLCGHLHADGIHKESQRIWKAAMRAAELSPGGAKPIGDEKLLFAKDTTTIHKDVSCSRCLARLDYLFEIGGDSLAGIKAGKLWLKTPPAPEYRSVDDFVAFMRDDERTSYTHEDLTELRQYLETSAHDLKFVLKAKGLKLEVRGVPRRVRGFLTSSNDRYFGPGSEKTHGGGSGF